jgi:hypothetical protein
MQVEAMSFIALPAFRAEMLHGLGSHPGKAG